jgi:hypothetical protein
MYAVTHTTYVLLSQFFISIESHSTMLLSSAHAREYSTFTRHFYIVLNMEWQKDAKPKRIAKRGKSVHSKIQEVYIDSKAAKRCMWPARTDFNFGPDLTNYGFLLLSP